MSFLWLWVFKATLLPTSAIYYEYICVYGCRLRIFACVPVKSNAQEFGRQLYVNICKMYVTQNCQCGKEFFILHRSHSTLRKTNQKKRGGKIDKKE